MGRVGGEEAVRRWRERRFSGALEVCEGAREGGREGREEGRGEGGEGRIAPSMDMAQALYAAPHVALLWWLELLKEH